MHPNSEAPRPCTSDESVSAPHWPTILPGSTVGILGGGQLGRMMVLAGRRMGYRFATMDPTPDSPAGQVSDIQVVQDFTSVHGARELARHSDVITYEFENVDSGVASLLEGEAYVPQGSRLLFLTQHRLREKRAVTAAGATVAPYYPVASRRDFFQGLSELGYPSILKTCVGGYDGKGQWLVQTEDDAEQVWAEIGHRFFRTSAPPDDASPSADAFLVLEQMVPFERELSVVVARNPRGQICTFPVAENIHRNHILHLSIVPARIPEETARRACDVATAIASHLNLVGVMGVELFQLEDGRIFVNELAPRPHNSGHFTMDACATSQFEQHIRALCNLPLGAVELWSPVVMVNILGEHVAAVNSALAEMPDCVKVHYYGKAEVRNGRKMGHLNVLGATVEDAMAAISQLGIWPE